MNEDNAQSSQLTADNQGVRKNERTSCRYLQEVQTQEKRNGDVFQNKSNRSKEPDKSSIPQPTEKLNKNDKITYPVFVFP